MIQTSECCFTKKKRSAKFQTSYLYFCTSNASKLSTCFACWLVLVIGLVLRNTSRQKNTDELPYADTRRKYPKLWEQTRTQNTFDLDQYDFQPGGRGCTKGPARFHTSIAFIAHSLDLQQTDKLFWIPTLLRTSFCSAVNASVVCEWVRCVCVYVCERWIQRLAEYVHVLPSLFLTFASLARHCMYALFIACKHHKNVRASGHTQHWIFWYYLPCQESKVTNHRFRLTEDHLHLLQKEGRQ